MNNVSGVACCRNNQQKQKARVWYERFAAAEKDPENLQYTQHTLNR
jgi:hypothetical protein